MAFYVNNVRNLANKYGWMETEYSSSNCVISFSRGKERLNVYYSTGTVSTCADYTKLGSTQLFRKKVSYQELEALFQNVNNSPGGFYRRSGPGQKEPKLARQMWWGSVDDSLLQQFVPGKTVLVSLGDGWFAMDDDGRYKFNGNTPYEFTNKLTGRQRQGNLPGIDLVALSGSDDRYFLQFADGEQQWNYDQMTDEFNQCMKESIAPVQTIAFSPKKKGFYVKFKSRHYQWANVPKDLDEYLNKHQLDSLHQNLPAVDEVNIGPNEEWFVRFEDGSWWVQGHNEKCDERITKIHEFGGHVRNIVFGSNRTWLITYFDRT